MGKNAHTKAAHTADAHLTTPTPLTGAEIVWATLVGEGVTMSSAIRAERFCPSTTRCASFPFITSWCATSRARRTWPTATRAPRAKWACASPPAVPGATNLVTGIATAMLDSIPVVCITGKVSSKVLGTDAFQEVDITGITLPITKHNFLVSKTEDIAPAIRYAFQIAAVGPSRPGAGRHHQGCAAGHGHLRLRSCQARAVSSPPDVARRRSGLHHASR